MSENDIHTIIVKMDVASIFIFIFFKFLINCKDKSAKNKYL